MKLVFHPDPRTLSTPMIAFQMEFNGENRHLIANYVPIISWLVEHVGELGRYDDGEWPHGNGWEVGYDYHDKTGRPWEKNHYVVIRRNINKKLLTEFYLRFS